jgi:predicted DNA-binding transcriptional regulator YafY
MAEISRKGPPKTTLATAEKETRCIARCLKLVALLRGDEARTTVELAKELRVCRRTIFRDLRVLKASGIPIHRDSRGYYCPHARHLQFWAPSFTAEETILLLVAARLSPLSRGQRTRTAVHKALADLLTQSPPEVRTEASRLLESLAFESATVSWREEETDVLLAIIKAIREGRSLRVRCRSPQGHVVDKTIAHFRLVATEEDWCVECASHDKVWRLELRHIVSAQ